MAFHENAFFPENLSVGTRGGPGFSTSIVEGDSGSSERVSRWANARRKYNAKYGIRTVDDLNVVLSFYIARSGPAVGFRLKDHLDFTTAANHTGSPTNVDCELFPTTATGTSGQFQLRTKYVSGGVTVFRTIQKPRAGTILIARTPSGGGGAVNISAFTPDTTTGLITIASGLTAGDTMTGGCQFDVPVQFAAEIDDVLAASIDNFNSGDIPDIPMVEMVGTVASPERFYYGGGSLVAPTANNTIVNLDFSAGRTFAVAPTNTTWASTVLVPDPTDLEPGGPYFHIINISGGDMTIKTFDNVNTIVTLTGGTLSNPKAAIMVIYFDGTVNKWAALSN